VLHVLQGGAGDVGRYHIMSYTGTLTDNGLRVDLSDLTGIAPDTVKGRPVNEYLQEFSFVEILPDQHVVDVRIQAHYGDANVDGSVNVGDLGILATNYGRTDSPGWRFGDFNLDGTVNVGDLGILATNYGWSWTPPSLPGGMPQGAPVPEPATMALLTLGAAAILRRRK